MSKLGLIIQREYSARVRKKSFLWITLLVPLLIAGLSFVAMWFSIQEMKQIKVLVVDPDDLCQGKIFVNEANAATAPAIFDFYAGDISVEDFETNQNYQHYDLMLGIRKEVITNKGIKGFFRDKIPSKAEYYIRDRIELRLEEYFAIEAGISLNKYRRIRQGFNFKLESVDPNKRDTTYSKGVGLVFSLVIFFFVLLYASQVTRSVIEEKTSRIVEIIVSSVKPIQLLMGKIIGIGLVGITQFAIWIFLIGIALVLMRSFVFQDMLNPAHLADAFGSIDSSSANVLTTQGSGVMYDSPVIDVIYNGIPWATLLFLFFMYFIGGYLLYGGIFAVVGAASDSESDSQQAMIPVQLVLIFFLFIGIYVVYSPAGPTALWFSQIPFSSPFAMLQRVAAGTVHYSELIISFVVLAGAIFLFLKGAAKVYRTGILMYGKKASWKEIIRWMRY